MDFSYFCKYCGVGGQLLRCAGCRRAYYCCKEHQKNDWKRHKKQCHEVSKNTQLPVNNSSVRTSKSQGFVNEDNKFKHSSRGDNNLVVQNAERNSSPFTFEGSSESEIISTDAEELDHILEYLQSQVNSPSSSTNNSLVSSVSKNPMSNYSDVSVIYPDILGGLEVNSLGGGYGNFSERLDTIDVICHNVIKDMDAYGVCAVDNFLGHENGIAVLNEVINMYQTGVFKDGQLVSNKIKRDSKTIRGDQITWIDGKEQFCQNIGKLIRKVDEVIMRANTMPNNGKLGDYKIFSRTKAMVACYPGHGSHYVKHVDNPNRDGRCITAIYYLNLDWDIQQNGGLLRIFPEGTDQVADIEPLFDRILFFWSDRRNPHEVQPAFKTRYAITLWYYDKGEREDACRRYQVDSMCCGLPGTRSNPPLVTNCS